MKPSKALYVALAVLILLFGYFVYPTRYHYLDTPFVDNDLQMPLRVDRLTGGTQMFDPDVGWIDAPAK